jgi:hypothetical protein
MAIAEDCAHKESAARDGAKEIVEHRERMIPLVDIPIDKRGDVVLGARRTRIEIDKPARLQRAQKLAYESVVLGEGSMMPMRTIASNRSVGR